jgi:hypothetical protein
LTVRGNWVPNPIPYSHLRSSASIIIGKKVFTLSIPPSIKGYHSYSKHYLVWPLYDSIFLVILPRLIKNIPIWIVCIYTLHLFYILELFTDRILKKLPTNPLRLFRTTNVRVSGVTESSGTSYLDNTHSKVISFFLPLRYHK